MPGRGEMSGFDDGPSVVFSKKPGGGGGGGGGGGKSNSGMSTSAKGQAGLSMAALENSDETSHVKVPTDLKLAIQKARTAKGMSQKDLDQRCVFAAGTVNKYEAGKIVPNNQQIAKMGSVLATQLPRVPKPGKK